MEKENAAATQAPKDAEVEEAKAEPSAAAADTEETVADTEKTAAAPSKGDESTSEAVDVDDKKSKETSEEPTAEKPKEEEEAESTTEEATPASAEKTAEPSPTGRGRRERKATQRLQPVEAPKKKERVISDGKGEKLEDIPNVVANFKGVTWSDPHLKMLYSLVFGQGKKKEFKAHLLQFSGLVYPKGKDEEEQDKMKNKMYKWTMPELKDVMDLVDIDRSKDGFGLDKKEIPGKEEHCQLLLEWLEEPKASGKKLKGSSKKSPGKRKSTGSAKESAKKAPAKKAKKTADKKTTPKKASATKKAATKTSSKAKASDAVDLNIPGVDIEKVRTKVKTIVENANREELTVKGVRKMLEDWLDTDLSEHKDAVRSIVMEVM
eukprot:CAMPEP_0172310420 /NCGR_PEP_ID=MMETSP1058-20130122/11474_1 /TAXON_ID=83371 /ORGANISM="Detonula confervacea, Strain CCMP 353" /LENGTH=377 /DNA_ID=CAMNT_0013023223 /DNA_START=139 /DNA_END=1272 /DNA_ORIENTATION=-